MTENFASYGDPDKSAQARLARVQAALGCKTWADLADLLELPVSLEAAAEGEDASSAWAQNPAAEPAAAASASLEAAILRNMLRCIPTSRMAAELKRRERERFGR